MARENLTKNNKTGGLNYQMCVLSAIGIIFVIFGHIHLYRDNDYAIATFYSWFPYYSFHMPVFLFISGYFFKDPVNKDSLKKNGSIKALASFFLKLCKKLLIPYFVINGIFLLINSFLRTQGFTYGTPFSFKEWLLNPWTKCISITYSLPTWYLLGFFYAQIYFVLLRKIAGLILKNEKAKEITLLAITLAIGIFAVQYCNTNTASQALVNFLRAAAMLFFMQFGTVYRKHLEKLDRLPGSWYFIILFAVQCAVLIISGNGALTPRLYNMTEFGIFGYDYFLCGLTGLLLWLRVAGIIASLPKKSRLLIYIGNNTKYIMSFHIFGFFLLNCLFMFLRSLGINFSFISQFSTKTFHTYLYYFLPDFRTLLLYFFAGLFLSLFLAKTIELVKTGLQKLLCRLRPPLSQDS